MSRDSSSLTKLGIWITGWRKHIRRGNGEFTLRPFGWLAKVKFIHRLMDDSNGTDFGISTCTLNTCRSSFVRRGIPLRQGSIFPMRQKALSIRTSQGESMTMTSCEHGWSN
jgi:hypothetical protein